MQTDTRRTGLRASSPPRHRCLPTRRTDDNLAAADSSSEDGQSTTETSASESTACPTDATNNITVLISSAATDSGAGQPTRIPPSVHLPRPSAPARVAGHPGGGGGGSGVTSRRFIGGTRAGRRAGGHVSTWAPHAPGDRGGG